MERKEKDEKSFWSLHPALGMQKVSGRFSKRTEKQKAYTNLVGFLVGADRRSFLLADFLPQTKKCLQRVCSGKKERPNNKIAFIVLLVFATFFFSCKMNMESLIDEYNKMFVPSEDILWTTENIEKSTMSFEDFELKAEYQVSKDTGLFILGGPRECDLYVWTLNGVPKSGNQILELRIKNEKTDLGSGAWTDNGSLPPGDCILKLQTRKGGVTKFWETKLIITP